MRLAGAYGVFVHEPRPQPGRLAVALPEARHSVRSIGFAIATSRDQLSPTPRRWLATATGRRRVGKASRGGTKKKKKSWEPPKKLCRCRTSLIMMTAESPGSRQSIPRVPRVPHDGSCGVKPFEEGFHAPSKGV